MNTLTITSATRLQLSGGLLLFIAGTVDVIVGLVGGIASVSPPSVTASVLGPQVAAAIPSAAFSLASGGVLVIACLELLGGWTALTGRSWYVSIGSSVLGVFVLVTLPLNLMAFILIAIAEGRFNPG